MGWWREFFARVQALRTPVISGEDLIRASAFHHAERPTGTFVEHDTLPDEYRTPEAEALIRRIEPRLVEIMSGPSLLDEDYLFIGQVIQIFNSIENNLNHCQRLFLRAGFLSKEVRQHSNRRDLFRNVRRGIKALGLSEKDTELALLAMIHLKRLGKFRDQFAHWLIKPVNDENAIVMFSFRDRDAAELQGDVGDLMVAQYAPLARQHLAQIASEVIQLEQWLANKSKDWHILLFGFEEPRPVREEG